MDYLPGVPSIKLFFQAEGTSAGTGSVLPRLGSPSAEAAEGGSARSPPPRLGPVSSAGAVRPGLRPASPAPPGPGASPGLWAAERATALAARRVTAPAPASECFSRPRARLSVTAPEKHTPRLPPPRPRRPCATTPARTAAHTPPPPRPSLPELVRAASCSGGA